MKTKILFSSIFLLLLLVACDPGRVLSFHTSGKPNVSITVYANTGILPGHYTPAQEKIIIHLPDPAKQNPNDTALFYGLGTWRTSNKDTTDYYFQNFSKNIDSIIITNSDSRLILNTTQTISAYLQKHETGFAGSIIKITAK